MRTELTVDLTKSSRFQEEASRYAPGGSPDGKWWAPNFIYAKHAKGCRLTDIDGNEFIDYYCGPGQSSSAMLIRK
jgi:glutamate-1-semialdehyde 2,1-aminomutase